MPASGSEMYPPQDILFTIKILIWTAHHFMEHPSALCEVCVLKVFQLSGTIIMGAKSYHSHQRV